MKHRIIAFPLLFLLILSLCLPVFADYTEGCFLYTINNGAVTITKYFGDEETVWVPASIAGYPVSTIAAGAFVDTSAKNLRLPDTVMTVEAGAVSSDMSLVYNANTGTASGAVPGEGLGSFENGDYEDSYEALDAPTEATSPTVPSTEPTRPPHPTNPTRPPHPANPTRPTTPSSFTGSGGGSNVTTIVTQPTAAMTEPSADLGEQEEWDTEANEEIVSESSNTPEITAAESTEAPTPMASKTSFQWLWISFPALCGLSLLGFWIWRKRRN